MSEVKAMSLNQYGSLVVTRGTAMKKQFCPFRKFEVPATGKIESAFCECACALFGEPEHTVDGKVRINLCHNSFECVKENFKDDRI